MLNQCSLTQKTKIVRSDMLGFSFCVAMLVHVILFLKCLLNLLHYIIW